MEHNDRIPNQSDSQPSLETQREILELERRLHLLLRPQPAPAGLRTRVLAQARARRNRQHGRGWLLQRVAASLVIAAVFSGVALYRQQEERRKGEAAREQVLTALRITNHALQNAANRVNDHDNDDQ